VPKNNKKTANILEAELSIGGINLTQKAIFAKNLSVMLKAGVTISEALQIIIDSTNGKFKKIIIGVLKSVEAGQSLADSLARYPKVFSGIFRSAILIGESSGTLSENLESISKQLEKERELRAKVINAMLYPVVVLVAAFFLGLVIAFLVLPKIVPLFLGLKVKLPLSTKVLIWLASVIENYGLFIFIILIATAAFLIWICRQKFSYPVTHWLLLRLPLVKNIIRNLSLASFCRTLGLLLQSGLNIDEAFKVTGDSLDNYYFRQSLNNIAASVNKGMTISENLANYKRLYPVMMVRMIMVGEKSGKLEDSLFYLANFYEDEVDKETKSLSASIEPVLLIIIGLVVGFLALSIITPIYSITSGMRN